MNRDQPEVVGTYSGPVVVYWPTAPQPIGDTTYANVLRARLTMDASEGRPTQYEWVRNVGIVRQRIWQSTRLQTWTLVRSRIVQ